MRKVNIYKCPNCNKKFKTLNGWVEHMNIIHPTIIPTNYTPKQYFYYLQTGIEHGTCIVCKKDTDWNESTLKYSRYCNNPKCKNDYREMFKNRMMNTYDGKVHLLNDPEQQRKMIKGRKISGVYKFKDGGLIDYCGTYEKDFLIMLDSFLDFPSSDVMGPSPHNYYYDYKNPADKEHEGKKFYIPDFYIPSINLEIEIKENRNMHPEILAINKVKEALKDKAMNKLGGVNYVKLVEKDYSKMFQIFEELKEFYQTKDESFLSIIKPHAIVDSVSVECDNDFDLND